MIAASICLKKEIIVNSESRINVNSDNKIALFNTAISQNGNFLPYLQWQCQDYIASIYLC